MPIGYQHPERVAVVETPPKHYAADPTRDQPVGNTKSERKHISVIERRIDYLRSWIEDHPDYTDLSWRRQEIAALSWALERIGQIEREES